MYLPPDSAGRVQFTVFNHFLYAFTFLSDLSREKARYTPPIHRRLMLYTTSHSRSTLSKE